MSNSFSVSVKHAPLRRTDFVVRSDMPDSITTSIFYAGYDLERRHEPDRMRPHVVTLSVIESVENIDYLNDIAMGLICPTFITLVTRTRGGTEVNRRHFKNLRIKNVSGSYAIVNDHESPLQRIVFEGFLDAAGLVAVE